MLFICHFNRLHWGLLPPETGKESHYFWKNKSRLFFCFQSTRFFFALMSLIDSMVGVAFYHELLVVWLCLRLWHTTIYLSMLTLLWVMVYNMFFPSISPCYRLNWNLKLNKCLNLKPKMRSCLLFNKKKWNESFLFNSSIYLRLVWQTLYNQTFLKNDYEWRFYL